MPKDRDSRIGRDTESREGLMRGWWRLSAIWVLAACLLLAAGTGPGSAEPRAHVYLLRGLLNIFSLGMDTLSQELNNRGVYATVDNHTAWQGLADQAAARYKAGTEGPIIIIGHSLGADAAMEMAAYLGQKGVPVALVVPFDGTASYAASSNVGRVINLSQHYWMGRGPGFKGTLVNVDLRSDPNIDHLNIDKSPRLHARIIAEVLSVVGSHRMGPPGTTTPKPIQVNAPQTAPAAMPATTTPAPAPPAASSSSVKQDAAPAAPSFPPEPPPPSAVPAAPAKSGAAGSTMDTADAQKPSVYGNTPVIALPERSSGHVNSIPQ
jgi:pimeloyl-ACP methyl ester carboxylesterase